MTRQRLAAAAAAIALATMIAGCSTSLGEFFSSPPAGTDQQLAVAAAMKIAQRGCVHLAAALKPGEVEDLGTSLEYVSDLLSRNPDITPEQLAEDLAGASEDAAVFAPEILGVAALAAAKIPEDTRGATFYLVVQGVVSQCRRALGEIAVSGNAGPSSPRRSRLPLQCPSATADSVRGGTAPSQCQSPTSPVRSLYLPAIPDAEILPVNSASTLPASSTICPSTASPTTFPSRLASAMTGEFETRIRPRTSPLEKRSASRVHAELLARAATPQSPPP